MLKLTSDFSGESLWIVASHISAISLDGGRTAVWHGVVSYVKEPLEEVAQSLMIVLGLR